MLDNVVVVVEYVWDITQTYPKRSLLSSGDS